MGKRKTKIWSPRFMGKRYQLAGGLGLEPINLGAHEEKRGMIGPWIPGTYDYTQMSRRLIYPHLKHT